MVDKGKIKKKKKKPPRYFFLNGDAHRVLSINTGADLLTAWNYPQGRMVGYIWSDARQRMQRAFTTAQVGIMIGRSRYNIEKYIIAGHIEPPQMQYGLDEKRNKYQYLWSEKDIMGLHDYLLSVHRGRPRKDGKVIPWKLPSKAELRAMIRHEVVMYIKDSSGQFVPVWKEVDW